MQTNIHHISIYIVGGGGGGGGGGYSRHGWRVDIQSSRFVGLPFCQQVNTLKYVFVLIVGGGGGIISSIQLATRIRQ